MRGMIPGLGLPPRRNGDPTLALSLPFTSGTLPSIFAGIERSGLGGSWNADGSALGFGPHNFCLHSAALNTIPWLTRGTCSVDANNLITGIDTGTNDIYQVIGGLAGDVGTRYEPSFYAKQSDASGVVSFQNSSHGIGRGEWRIDLSLLPADWGLITRDHASVTVLSEFSINAAGGGAGPMFKKHSGTGTLSLYAERFNVNRGTTANTYVPTTTAARYLLRHPKHPLLSERGVLGEPQRQNELENSEAFDSWSDNSCTVTANATTAPNGVASADLLDPGTGTTQGRFNDTTSVVLAGETWTYSIFLRAGTSTLSRIQWQDFSAGSRAEAEIAWSGGVPSISATGGSGYVRSGVRALGSGWYRIFVTGTAHATPHATQRCWIQPDFGGGGNTVYAWGGQFEKGEYPSSYIATGSTTSTRTTDPRLTYTLPSALQTALATAGTLYVEFAFVGAGSAANASNRVVAGLYADSSNYINIYNISGNVGVFSRSSATNPIFTTSNGAPVDAYEVIRVALSWSGTAARLTVNGTSYGSGSSFSWPTMTTFALLNTWSGASATAGAIVPDARVYTRYMEDAEREALAHA